MHDMNKHVGEIWVQFGGEGARVNQGYGGFSVSFVHDAGKDTYTQIMRNQRTTEYGGFEPEEVVRYLENILFVEEIDAGTGKQIINPDKPGFLKLDRKTIESLVEKGVIKLNDFTGSYEPAEETISITKEEAPA